MQEQHHKSSAVDLFNDTRSSIEKLWMPSAKENLIKFWKHYQSTQNTTNLNPYLVGASNATENQAIRDELVFLADLSTQYPTLKNSQEQ
jgi:hypothetical protein